MSLCVYKGTFSNRTMNKVIEVSDNVFKIFCPGCQDFHTIQVNGNKNSIGVTWQFDLDLDHPTFSPSINLRTGTYANPNWIAPKGVENMSIICHFSVRKGMIRYWADTTHKLKGQLVELPGIQ